MDSIAHPRGKWQQLAPKPIEVFDKGISIPKTGMQFIPSSVGRRNRSKITEFTTKTRKRLRRAMLTLTHDDSECVGITFTVPWKGTNFEPLMDEFRDSWHRFTVSFRRDYPNSAMIYRVELQKRGAPHIHALTYIAYRDSWRDDGCALARPLPRQLLGQVKCDFAMMWESAVIDLHHGSYRAFQRSGVKVESIVSHGAMMRYICDHTSKHKQAQLGYQGKQWGIIGRDNLIADDSQSLPDFASERHEVLFRRCLRKVMRYRLQASRHHWKRMPPFGSVLKGSRRSVGEFYISRKTVLAMFEFTRKAAV